MYTTYVIKTKTNKIVVYVLEDQQWSRNIKQYYDSIKKTDAPHIIEVRQSKISYNDNW